MKPFYFSGELASSKSILNRALVIQSFQPTIKIIGESQADDVVFMRQALAQLNLERRTPIECGDAGTVLRFMALRAARVPGVHEINGSKRLFSRPQTELISILNQLGVDAELRENSLRIRSSGWRLSGDGLHISTQRSSQFASAVFLSAWGLPFQLPVSISKKIVSESYFRMTLQMVRDFGMRVCGQGPEFVIAAGQKIQRAEPYLCEPDLSSAFAVTALAVVAGRAEIQHFPTRSLQPDAIFVKLLSQMGGSLRYENDSLIVEQSDLVRGLTTNISNCPDLFPILGVLCALAGTPSRISGIGHLKFKESSRLERTRELIEWMGATVSTSDSPDGETVLIEPHQTRSTSGNIWVFDPDHDHRMAMAAEVARWAGFPIQVGDMRVVSKSFPEFALIAARSK